MITPDEKATRSTTEVMSPLIAGCDADAGPVAGKVPHKARRDRS